MINDIKINYAELAPKPSQTVDSEIVLVEKYSVLDGLTVNSDNPIRCVLFNKTFGSAFSDANREIIVVNELELNSENTYTLKSLLRGQEGTTKRGLTDWTDYILGVTPTAETFKQLEQTGYELYTAVQVSGAWSSTKNTDGTDNAGNTGQDNYQIDLEGDSYFIIYTSTNNKYTQATMRIDNAQTGSIIFTTPTEI